MTMKEAMRQRHTVRKYIDRPLPEEIIAKLQARIAENNEKHGLDIKLMVNDSSPFNAILKLILAKGVSNYFILSGPNAAGVEEKLGYSSADLMLYAQTLGLNTWWVGGTYSKKATAAHADGEKVIGVVTVGYGATQGSAHKSKKPATVSSYSGEAPDWFAAGVEAALLAPTAMGKQAFMIEGQGDEITVTYAKGMLSGADLGLVKYHFELGAGKENFRWTDE